MIEYGGLFPFNVARLQGKVFLPPIETKPRPMTIAEKIFARHMVHGANKVGVEAVKPGDTGFARTDLRFSHEYVTPMAAIFYEHYLGKDEPVNDASSHPVLPRPPHVSRRGAVGRKAQDGSARPGDAVEAEAGRLREVARHQAARRVARPQRFGRNLPLDRHRELRAAGPVERRLRLAHAACRRDGLRRVRHRHDRRLQFVVHQGRSREGAGVGEGHRFAASGART